MAEVAAAAGISVDLVAQRAAQLHESNPMLGHRGWSPPGITYPEIYEMQARAIFQAAAEVKAKQGDTAEPEIMIPLVSIPKELSLMRAIIDRVAKEVAEKNGSLNLFCVGP